MKALKAHLAGLASGLTALLAEWTSDNSDPLTPRDFLVASVAALVTWTAVYYAKNVPEEPEPEGEADSTPPGERG